MKMIFQKRTQRIGSRTSWPTLAFTLAALNVLAAETNHPVATNTPAPRVEAAPQKLDASAFRIVVERNIFNANRSGGTVRVASSRRPTRIDTFTLVGTMAYERGVFAFFEGSSSTFTKVLKPGGIIAGYKVMDILADGVKLELDGKEFELPVGSQMRREDEGTWHMAETPVSSGEASYASNRNTESDARSSRSSRDYSSRNRGRDEARSSSRSEPSPMTTTNSGANPDEVLKRLMEKREKE